MTDETKGGALVEHRQDQTRELAAPANAGNILAMVLEAARDPNIDAAKVETMANLAMRMKDREQEEQFNRDKIAALMEMPSIAKNGAILNKQGGVQSRYSKWEDIHRIVKPILERHNLAISFNVGHSGQMVTVQPILSHRNGYVEKGGEMVLPIDTTGSKNGTQGAGSAASYGKRHTAKAMLNIVEHGVDDDGQSAGGGSADPYDMLTDAERRLVDEGRREASGGLESYAAWFKALPPDQRGLLAYNKGANGVSWHDQNKALAEKV